MKPQQTMIIKAVIDTVRHNALIITQPLNPRGLPDLIFSFRERNTAGPMAIA
jgi:hypothetical protein